MQTYNLEIQDEAIPQVLAILKSYFSHSVKITPLSLRKNLSNVEQKTDLSLDLKEDFDELSSLDYLVVSDDKTDENWLKNLFSLMDNAIANSAVTLESSADRGWTRDEIYER